MNDQAVAWGKQIAKEHNLNFISFDGEDRFYSLHYTMAENQGNKLHVKLSTRLDRIFINPA